MSSAKETSTWAVYKRLLGYVKPYRKLLIIGILAGIFAGSSILGMLYGVSGIMSSQVDTQKNVNLAKEKQVVLSEGFSPNAPEFPEDLPNEIKAQINEVESKMMSLYRSSPKAEKWLREAIDIYDEDYRPSGGLMIIGVAFLSFFIIIRSLMTATNKFLLKWVGYRVVTDLRNHLLKN